MEFGNLCITRKAGEYIKIGPNIEITITKIERNQVKFRVRAPVEINIVRGEHLERGTTHIQRGRAIEIGKPELTT